jgi:hypothetical protein
MTTGTDIVAAVLRGRALLLRGIPSITNMSIS